MYAKIFCGTRYETILPRDRQEKAGIKLEKLLTFATGGGSGKYDGKTMAKAHKDRGLTIEDFDRVFSTAASTMKEL